MALLTYRDAVARGIAQEMERDEDVVFLGEDIAAAGGVFKASVGLLERFGPMRVFQAGILLVFAGGLIGSLAPSIA